LWYDFELQGFPVFVCDTRSGRTGRDRILDERQFDALTGWLHDNQERDNRDGADRPKFVISPSVIVPFRKPVKQDDMPACPSRSDSWDGFPSQLLQLFSFIAAEKIANVVFLCGDSHLSMTSKIFFENHRGDSLFTDKEEKRPLQAWCIVASPMYGPYPFVNPTVNEFHLQAKLDLPGIGAMRYGVSESWDKSGFTLVTVSRDQTGSWTIQAPHIDAVSEAPKKAEPAAAAAEAAAGAPSG
jgi:hypothetical protein